MTFLLIFALFFVGLWSIRPINVHYTKADYEILSDTIIDINCASDACVE